MDSEASSSQAPQQQQQQPQGISGIVINNQNEALALIFEMLKVAQSRGTFSFEESAKIHESMGFFLKK